MGSRIPFDISCETRWVRHGKQADSAVGWAELRHLVFDTFFELAIEKVISGGAMDAAANCAKRNEARW